jgi:sugar O-acyltransferase (sialic acid O-acetyltransferase NeuD family)
MKKKLYVYGAGGHGKVVADILLSLGLPLAGFLDDGFEMAGRKILDLPVLGGIDWLLERRAAAAVALGIGNNLARQKVADRLRQRGIDLPAAIHSSAVVAASTTIGAGVVVMAGAVINPDAKIGRGAIINSGAIIEHDVVVGDFAHVSPGAVTGGAVRIGELAHVGLGARILPGISVGPHATVGAGAVVIREVAPGITVAGVPAMPVVAKAKV